MATELHLHFWTLIVVAILTWTSCCMQLAEPVNVVNDVNNMLRDAHSITEIKNGVQVGKVVAIGGNAHRTHIKSEPETEQILRSLHAVDNHQHDESTINDDGVDDSDAYGDGDGDADADDNINPIDEEQSQSSVELLRFVNDDDDDDADSNVNNDIVGDADHKVVKQTKMVKKQMTTNSKDVQRNAKGTSSEENLSLNDQVRLLTKQLNALMMRRREDYELLEHNLRKSLRITTDAVSVDANADIRNELVQLRNEVQTLRDMHLNGNKERLTVEWLQQSVAEIRKQLVELQQVASNVARDMHTRTQSYEDLATIRNDFQQIKLELVALRERQDTSEVYMQELREELLQQEEDFKRLLHNKRTEIVPGATTAVNINGSQQQHVESLNTEPLADHNRRHCRFQHQQIHELQLAQRNLRRQVNELKYHRIGERVRNIEIEQHRIANANFNLSRQIASLDKLHSSMLELLEDVEGLQNKIDKSVPELRHEISKLEFANAQITSEQSLVREEGQNAARTLQAMAVSISALQDERDGVKAMESAVELMRTNVDRLQTIVQSELNSNSKRKHNKLDKIGIHGAKTRSHKHNAHHSVIVGEQKPPQQQVIPEITVTSGDMQQAETLVAELENVETQYENIINKLPQDCSDVAHNTEGLHMIAPAGQHHPLMTHCTDDGWTTVQRRFDGSADFNRSWVDYSQGFGVPAGEYWIGNEQLHHLTLNNCTRLRVIMQDIYDNTWVAEYGHFYISSRDDGYRLNIADYSGNASDALNYQQGMQFSAIDEDRDISQTHCAANYEGGWWFSHCQHANLNGRYNLGLTWFDAARNEWIAVKSSQMMIKRQAAATCDYIKSSTSVHKAPASAPAPAPVSATVMVVAAAKASTSSSVPSRAAVASPAAPTATATTSTSTAKVNVVGAARA